MYGVYALALVFIVGQNTGVAALPSNVHRGRLPDGVLRSHADLAERPLEDAADDVRQDAPILRSRGFSDQTLTAAPAHHADQSEPAGRADRRRGARDERQ